MNRPVCIIFKGQAKLEFCKLKQLANEQQANGIHNSPEQQLLKSIEGKFDILKSNPLYGDQVPRGQIPPGMNVSNLFVIKLNGYWRMLYTLEGNQLMVVAFILFVVDHPTYDKMFGYRKK